MHFFEYRVIVAHYFATEPEGVHIRAAQLPPILTENERLVPVCARGWEDSNGWKQYRQWCLRVKNPNFSLQPASNVSPPGSSAPTAKQSGTAAVRHGQQSRHGSSQGTGNLANVDIIVRLPVDPVALVPVRPSSWRVWSRLGHLSHTTRDNQLSELDLCGGNQKGLILLLYNIINRHVRCVF